MTASNHQPKGPSVFKDYLKDDDIKMQSKDGLVTLAGTVAEASHKSLAGETVAGLPGKFASDVHGVKKVVNNMTVE